MRPMEWFRRPRQLLSLFFVLTLFSAGALGWLGWQLFRQDRALESQRIQERLENAADLVTAALQKSLSETEEQLTDLGALPAAELPGRASDYARQFSEDSVLAAFLPGGVEPFPRNRLLYYPLQPAEREPPAALFAAAEAAEFQQRDYPKAIATLEELARSADPLIRAGALVRLGRNLRKLGRWTQALAVYEQLAKLGAVPAGGSPAELVAQQARCTVLEEHKDARMRDAALALYAGLQDGRWRLDRATYSFYVEEATRWLGPSASPPTPNAALALAAAVESLWKERQHGERSPRGRRVLWTGDRSILLLWRGSQDRIVVLAAGPDSIGSRWLARQHEGGPPLLKNQGVRVALEDMEGRPVVGEPEGTGNQHALRLASATGLPWTLRAISAGGDVGIAAFAGRRRLLVAGLSIVTLLVLGGSYLIGRAVAREFAVARQQSDFVSAVSHEFRTPLTTLRQLSELLAKRRVASDEDKQQYYDLLLKDSERLHRLVEGLLDFGRLEAGKMQYRFEQFDAGDLLREVVADFQGEAEALGFRVELSANGAAPIRADREALRCVVWNLLDNAVKYSPDCRTIWVNLERQADNLVIGVRDRGVGVARSEQKGIFDKFVRGASAKAGSIRGVGIGLAVARQIVIAHGGEITLESEPGSGSTFRVVLPVVES